MQLAIILTRHGVRSPLQSNEEMASLASQPWPKWEVPPGVQTPRGNILIAYMGDYYRERFLRSGLLSGDPSKDSPLVYIRADNDERTLETGRILGKALVQSGDPEVHSLPKGTLDPLFQAEKARVGHPDLGLAAASVLGRVGGDPSNLDRAYAPQLAELKGILFGPGATPPAGSPFNDPTVIVADRGSYLIKVSGPVRAALSCIDSLVLEYTDGKPAPETGWGRVDAKVIGDLLVIHDLFFDLTQRTRYPAQVNGSNLASHIIDTLEQAALGQSVPGAFGPPGERVVILAGHDTNIANIGGLLDMNWWIPGTQKNPLLPGGALIFELWKRPGETGGFYVRAIYVSQTLEQLRDATPLSLEHPPGLSPIFIPGCSGPGPNFDAPLAGFVRQARQVIDPSFITSEP